MTLGWPAIFRRFPEIRQRLAWTQLADGLPTPVEPLPDLAAALGLGPGTTLLVKRDDRTSSLYGGNKVRKLEWIIGRARARGARSLHTVGAIGSHHALATAIFAAKAGLQVRLNLFPQPITPHVEEVLRLDRSAGAEIAIARTYAGVAVRTALGLARARLRGERPYYVAPGGSDAFGTLGYVSAALELAEQVKAGASPVPDVICVPAGTCGTLAGLALGLALAGPPLAGRTSVVGVRVVPRLVASERRVRRLARKAAALLGVPSGTADVAIVQDQLGRGYGFETEAAREVAALAARHAPSLELDPTYTAKALAGLRAIARGTGGSGRAYLFWHTLAAHHPEPVPGPESSGP